MPPTEPSMTEIAAQVSLALQSADLDSFADLLDPNVRWGAPGDQVFGCQNRDQVLAWYRRGRARGVSARVTETVVQGDRILVGLQIDDKPGAETSQSGANRWQILTVRHGRIADIRGFEDRADAQRSLN